MKPLLFFFASKPTRAARIQHARVRARLFDPRARLETHESTRSLQPRVERGRRGDGGRGEFRPTGRHGVAERVLPSGRRAPTTVQQTRTRGAAAASYYDYGDDDDFRYNEEGATASGVGRWPTFSLGSVILCVLIAMAVALGTNVRALTVVPADADARALAARVTAVGQSVDVMAQALAAEAKAAAKAGGAKAARAHARDLSALKDDVGKLAARSSPRRTPSPASRRTPRRSPRPNPRAPPIPRSFRRSSSRWRR